LIFINNVFSETILPEAGLLIDPAGRMTRAAIICQRRLDGNVEHAGIAKSRGCGYWIRKF